MLFVLAGNECRHYKVLDEPDRAMSFADPSVNKCDGREQITSPGWYRMTGKAGNKIPEKCVPTQQCGTKAPGWLNSKHPTVQEGVVTREVCYHWSDNCCKWKNNIKIRNCGGYFVYELQKPPTCSLRYCGNKESEYEFLFIVSLANSIVTLMNVKEITLFCQRNVFFFI